MNSPQELVMIPVLLGVVLATFNLRDSTLRKILCGILTIQLVTHVRMHYRPFRCNPSTPSLCNKVALILGVIMSVCFTISLCTDKSINRWYILGLVTGFYSVFSHIVYIPLNDVLRKNEYARWIATGLGAFIMFHVCVDARVMIHERVLHERSHFAIVK